MEKGNRLTNKIIWLLTCCLFAFFVIFRVYLWGKYFLLATSLAILFLSTFGNGGKIFIKIQSYHVYIFAFIAYAFISSLWAWNSADSIERTTTMLLILVCASMVYCHYIRFDDVHQLLTAIMWAGFAVSIYTLSYYGFSTVIEALTSVRLGSSFANVNTIAQFLAVTCIIQFSEIVNKRRKMSAVLMMLPEIIVIAATQSRMPLVVLFLGITGIYFFNNFESKNARKTIKTIFVVVLIALVIIYIVFNVPAFSGIQKRLTGLLNSFYGSGDVDGSTSERNEMIALGWEYFLKNPIVGIGIGCSHIISGQHLGNDTYLHNNFVELLCGGGAMGFLIFYSRYIYLFYNLFKYRRVDKEHFSICFVLLFVMFISDWGTVSYYDKLSNYYFILQFLNIEYLKRKSRINKRHEYC